MSISDNEVDLFLECTTVHQHIERLNVELSKSDDSGQNTIHKSNSYVSKLKPVLNESLRLLSLAIRAQNHSLKGTTSNDENECTQVQTMSKSAEQFEHTKEKSREKQLLKIKHDISDIKVLELEKRNHDLMLMISMLQAQLKEAMPSHKPEEASIGANCLEIVRSFYMDQYAQTDGDNYLGELEKSNQLLSKELLELISISEEKQSEIIRLKEVNDSLSGKLLMNENFVRRSEQNEVVGRTKSKEETHEEIRTSEKFKFESMLKKLEEKHDSEKLHWKQLLQNKELDFQRLQVETSHQSEEISSLRIVQAGLRLELEHHCEVMQNKDEEISRLQREMKENVSKLTLIKRDLKNKTQRLNVSESQMKQQLKELEKLATVQDLQLEIESLSKAATEMRVKYEADIKEHQDDVENKTQDILKLQVENSHQSEEISSLRIVEAGLRLELEHHCEVMQNKDEEISRLQREMKENVSKLTLIKRDLKNKTQRLNVSESQMKQQLKELEKLAKLQDLQLEIESLSKAATEMRVKYEADIKEHQDDVENKTQDILRLQVENSHQSEEISSLRIVEAGLRLELEHHCEVMQNKDEEISRLQREMKENVSKLTLIKRDLKNKTQRLNVSESQMKQQLKELEKLATVQDLQLEIESLSKAATEMRVKYEADIKEHQDDVENKTQDILRLQVENSHQSEEISSLRIVEAGLRFELEHHCEVMQNKDEEISRLQREIRENVSKLTLIKRDLKNKTQRLNVSESQMKQQLKELEKLATVQDLQLEIESLSKAATEMRVKYEADIKEHQDDVENKTQDILRLQVENSHQSDEISSLRIVEAGLRLELEHHCEVMQNKDEEISRLQREMKENVSKLTLIKRDLKNKTKRLTVSESQMKQQLKELEKLATVQDLQLEIESLSKAATEMRVKYEAGIKEHQDDVENKTQDILRLQVENSHQSDEISSLRIVEAGLRLELEHHCEVMQNKDEEISRLQREMKENAKELTLIKRDLKNKTEKLNVFRSQVQMQLDDRETAKGLQLEIESLSKAATEMRVKYEADIKEHQDDVENKTQDILRMQTEIKELRETINTLEESRNNLTTKLEEQNKVVVQATQLRESNQSAKQEIANLRKIVSTVNSESLQMEKENNMNKKTLQETSRKVTVLLKENEELKKCMVESDDQIETLRGTIHSMEHMHHEHSTIEAKSQAKIEEMGKQLEIQQALIEKHKSEIVHFSSENKQKDVTVGSLQTEMEELRETIRTLKESCNNLKTKLEEQNKVVVQATQLRESNQSANQEIANLRKIVSTVNSESLQMEKKNKLNIAKLEEMERQLQSFQALEEKYKSEIIYLSNEVKRKTVAVIRTDAGCQTTSCGESWSDDQITLPLTFGQNLHSEDPLSLRSRVEHEVKIRDLEKSIASLTALLQIKESEILKLQKAKDTLQTQIDELLYRNTEVQSTEQKSEHSGVQHSDLEEIKSKLKDLETKLSSKHRNQHNQGRDIQLISFANIKLEFENIQLRREISVAKSLKETMVVGVQQNASKPSQKCSQCSRMEVENSRLRGDIERLALELGHFEKYFFEEVDDLNFNYKQATKMNLLYEGQLKSIAHRYNIKVDVMTSSEVERF